MFCVLDASALIELLIQGPGAGPTAAILAGRQPVAPDLIYVEVLAALRRLVRLRTLDLAPANRAVASVQSLPLDVYPVEPLIPEIWSLRDTLTASDAAYVALAQSLSYPLVTADARLSRAPGLGIAVILV